MAHDSLDFWHCLSSFAKAFLSVTDGCTSLSDFRPLMWIYCQHFHFVWLMVVLLVCTNKVSRGVFITWWHLVASRCSRRARLRRQDSIAMLTTIWSLLHHRIPTPLKRLSAGLAGEAPSMDVSEAQKVSVIVSFTHLSFFGFWNV